MSTKTSEIFDDLKNKIMNEVYSSGSKLPTEQELVSYYGASRNTIRNVLKELEIEGIIFSIQGSGYYTQNEKVIDSIALRSLGELNSSKIVKNEVLDFKVIRANHEYSQLFDIPLNGKLFYFRRKRYKNGLILQLEDSYLPFFLFPTLSFQDVEGSIFNYVEKNRKFGIKYALRDYESVLLTSREKSLFKLPPEQPIAAMKTTSINYLDIGRIFEKSIIVEPGAVHTNVARRH